MTTVVDGRQMQPPEPMQRILEALDGLAEGDDVLLLSYCQPHPLFSILKRNGYAWSEGVRDDGTREIRIHKLPG
jgi:uncharacterized protein (DUF2249 family)